MCITSSDFIVPHILFIHLWGPGILFLIILVEFLLKKQIIKNRTTQLTRTFCFICNYKCIYFQGNFNAPFSQSIISSLCSMYSKKSVCITLVIASLRDPTYSGMPQSDLHSGDGIHSTFGTSGFPRKYFNCHGVLGEGGLERGRSHCDTGHWLEKPSCYIKHLPTYLPENVHTDHQWHVATCWCTHHIHKAVGVTIAKLPCPPPCYPL